ncbi:Triose-phosphate Transporter family [Carpediemonas membranifera]|uniref:Triose-phosphate Transporter family n=1 Tax=Carpediemonas membranifera TaxID=201153 RepID=A0A8J6ART2_9EUKA|nr:Triose-phosphate Transporter family [Carpediemonas membranifera]|eukprot:KAG9392368.1 Triose-phosphate Transporter family [Carpediemonas membranifera]
MDVLQKNAVTLSFIAANTFSSVLIIAVNKVVFNAFPFPTFITFLHFIFTFSGLALCAKVGLFHPKKLSMLAVLPLSLAFCGYVVLNNLSLQYNQVGFYQTMKIMVTPTVAIIEVFIYKKKLTASMWYCLGAICLGIGICTVDSIQMNPIGVIAGVSAVISTSFYQVWSGVRQKSLQASSSQLLLYQVPMSMFILLFIFPLFDSPKDIVMTGLDATSGSMLLLSCCLSFAVNITIFLIIGRTNAVTYNVASHVKTVLNYCVAFIVFGDPLTWKVVVGIMLTLGGIFSYSYIKIKMQQQALSPPPAAAVSEKKEDV